MDRVEAFFWRQVIGSVPQGAQRLGRLGSLLNIAAGAALAILSSAYFSDDGDRITQPGYLLVGMLIIVASTLCGWRALVRSSRFENVNRGLPLPPDFSIEEIQLYFGLIRTYMPASQPAILSDAADNTIALNVRLRAFGQQIIKQVEGVRCWIIAQGVLFAIGFGISLLSVSGLSFTS